MEAKEVEKQPVKTTQLQTIKTNLKKWWLLPTMAILITIPMILVLTFPKDKAKANDTTKIVNNIFNYEPLQANEFTTTVTNYSQIKQQYIATVTKTLDIYLNQAEWDSLVPQELATELVKEKIVNNLSNKLRMIGLIEANKTLNLDETELVINQNQKPFDGLISQFEGTLNYRNSNEMLPIAGTLNLSQELINPLKTINNETMPKLINELKNNQKLKDSIKWNSYGFWYGLETTGEKDENNHWKGLQKVDLKEFNDVALAWFLDTLKITNLIDYNVEFEAENLHFYVDGWNKNNLYLKHEEGLMITDNYVILTADNFPWDEATEQVGSIVSTIDFGWKNPLNDEIITINSLGSYLVGPVWEYYDQA